MTLEALVAAHGEQLLVHGVQISRINTLLGLGEHSGEPKTCASCRKAVPSNQDGTLPPHQINGAVLGQHRRTHPVCMPKAVR